MTEVEEKGALEAATGMLMTGLEPEARHANEAVQGWVFGGVTNNFHSQSRLRKQK